MKIAIISDIHGNLEALKATLNDIEKRKTDKIICLGDIIAKGVHSKECIELIRKKCEIVIQGNCDEYFSMEHKNINQLNEQEQRRIKWNQSLINKEDRTVFAAKRNFLKNTVVLAFSLIMGIILDRFTTAGYELYGFMILFAIVFAIAFIDISIRIKTYKPDVIQEKINLKDFPCQLDNVTMRNQKIQINFTSSVMPFHFNTDTNISFSNIVKKYLESGKSTVELPLADNIICKIEFTSSKREQPFSIDLNCNRSSVTFLGEFQIINYSARILLNTLVDQRKIVEFSGDGYGVVLTDIPDEEIELKKILNSN